MTSYITWPAEHSWWNIMPCTCRVHMAWFAIRNYCSTEFSSMLILILMSWCLKAWMSEFCPRCRHYKMRVSVYRCSSSDFSKYLSFLALCKGYLTPPRPIWWFITFLIQGSWVIRIDVTNPGRAGMPWALFYVWPELSPLFEKINGNCGFLLEKFYHTKLDKMYTLLIPSIDFFSQIGFSLGIFPVV